MQIVYEYQLLINRVSIPVSIGKPAWIGLKMAHNTACSDSSCDWLAEWTDGLQFEHQQYTHFSSEMNKPCFHVRPDVTFKTDVCSEKMPYICTSACPKGLRTVYSEISVSISHGLFFSIVLWE